MADGVLRSAPVPDTGTWLSGQIAVAPLVAHFLLGVSAERAVGGAGAGALRCLPGKVADLAGLPVADTLRGALARVAARVARGERLLAVLEGRDGSGRATAAAAVARAAGRSLVTVDLAAARAGGEPFAELARTAAMHQRLWDSIIHLRGLGPLSGGESEASATAQLVSLATTACGTVLLSVNPETPWRDALRARRAITLSFEIAPAAVRRERWAAARRCAGLQASDAVLDVVASRFAMTPGQIARVAQQAVDARVLSEPVWDGGRAADDGGLLDAARAECRPALGTLASRVESPLGWDHLVLPDATIRQLREIAGAVAHRHVVYDDWGLARRLGGGGGLKVLFSGASGTGKTMAASVIARELGLDLFAIDLSGVVSKFIGETEKMLDKIFRAARVGDAILFFDEADALFGKRSQVKDAHDRYANIEVAYLLQQMESHHGVVILASNLSQNMDEAFARRMHYAVEFPLPSESARERLWRGMFPPMLPLAHDVDFGFLAKQFPFSGGEIRNVALSAAFLAAQNGGRVTMQHVVRATARQLVRQGRSPSPMEFKHHFPLIAQT